MHKLLDKVKLISFWWMKARKSGIDFEINDWWVNPTLIFG
jgi:hypothetical protein